MISIITPGYNVEKYIERCVKSVLEQTEKDFELILIDDGSTDSSGEKFDELSRTDARIKVIHKENGGVSSARNAGLETASGEYITFIDSDDWVDKNYLETLLSDMKNNDADISCCNFIYDDEKNTCGGKVFESKLLTKEEALDCYSNYYITSVGGKLYKKSVLKDLFFRSDLFYSEDTLFYTCALAKAESVFWNNGNLYHYYVNESGAMNSFVLNRRVTDFFARKEILKVYDSFPQLKNGAVCRAVASAISIEFKVIKTKTSYENQNILNDYIRENHRIFLKNPKINNKEKTVCLICSNPFLKKLFSVLFKIKGIR